MLLTRFDRDTGGVGVERLMDMLVNHRHCAHHVLEKKRRLLEMCGLSPDGTALGEGGSAVFLSELFSWPVFSKTDQSCIVAAVTEILDVVREEKRVFAMHTRNKDVAYLIMGAVTVGKNNEEELWIGYTARRLE